MRMRLDVAMRLQVVKALVDNSSDPIKTLHARDKVRVFSFLFNSCSTAGNLI